MGRVQRVAQVQTGAAIWARNVAGDLSVGDTELVVAVRANDVHALILQNRPLASHNN